MKKEVFQKKGYYKLILGLFFGSLIISSLFLIILGIFGSDVEVAGFFWAGVLCLIYWLIKRIFYFLMFKEKVFGNNQKGTYLGFVLGVIIALIWIIIMSRIYPEEDMAGLVILGSLISGLIFGFVGYYVQSYLRKKSRRNKK